MALPWLRILNAIIGLNDVARVVRRRSATSGELAVGGSAGPLEARLAGVVVAALKEAFDRDHLRLELEREQLEVERQRAERVMRLELARQVGDREIARLRLLAAVAAVSWLGTLFASAGLMGSTPAGRAAFGVGWLLLLASLGASFVAQSAVSRGLSRIDDRASADVVSSGPAGAMAPWLIVLGLAAIGLGVLLA